MKNIILFLLFAISFTAFGQNELKDTLDFKSIELRKDSLFYKIGSKQPYSGVFTRKAIKADRRSDWNRNGQTKIEGEIENGQAKGLWIEWHHNGKRISEMNMSKGKPNGSSASWYSNGQKKDEGKYFNGKKEGLWTYWYRYGVTNQKKYEIKFNKGEEISRKEWDKSGKEIER